MKDVKDVSILIGGKAGDGIRVSTTLLGRILSRYGYRVFVYDDYPSIIRGGHNFSIVRASEKKIQANTKAIDVLVALNKQTAEKHALKLKDSGLLIYDSSDKKLAEFMDTIDLNKEGCPFGEILKETGAEKVMRNSAAIGCLSRILSIEFDVVEDTLRKFLKKNANINVKVAKKAYYTVENPYFKIEKLDQQPLPLLTGNEAIALGAVMAGLDAYYAYPMTPSTSILHFLASKGSEYGITVVQPENEIAVMLMALGSAYAGKKTMVASSGGGFALMVEGLSLAGQAEIPIVIVVSQRAGPSTGVPTYTMQADLHFILNTGHGEFPRFVVAPGDADEAFYYTALAMNIAWTYQIPAFVLSDKHLSESLFSFKHPTDVSVEEPLLWDSESGDYKRYRITADGISPLAFPGQTIVKSNSYFHDENGITTEKAEKIAIMQEKRLRKRKKLEEEIEKLETVKKYGESDEVIVTWGSTKGVCIEAAETLGLKVIQPVILEPFPVLGLNKALNGVEKKVVVEVNSTGQLARLLRNNGIEIDGIILKYDARPFFLEELIERLEGEFR